MKAIRTWILVADGARARFLLNQGPGKGLEIPAMPELSTGHAPTREVGTDRPGRVHDRMGPGRHAMAPRVDWHQFEKSEFARRVATTLNKAAGRNDFDRLVLVAPPKTLGSLRAALDKAAAAKVTAELPKDLTHVSVDVLPNHLGDLIAL